MKFLLINDDGIHAPGLSALERAVARLGAHVTVAPNQHLSGCGHQATTHRPLQLTSLAENRHMLDGTPADCTRVGLTHVAPDVDWVIAGVNEGGNLGADVYMSGTVAAVREAALLGKPGIAVSHYVRRDLAVDWERVTEWTETVLRGIINGELLNVPPATGQFWSVNFPHLDPGTDFPTILECPLDPNPLPVAFDRRNGLLHYRGNYHARRRNPGHDVDVCFSGKIAVTRLTVR